MTELRNHSYDSSNGDATGVRNNAASNNGASVECKTELRPCRKLALLVLGAMGIVYGDIGTGPLYAFRESLVHVSSDGLVSSEILGIVSLILWALILMVTVKYVHFLMCADNEGEGGTLSLLSLVEKAMSGKTTMVFMLGASGAALFYGDAILTPAISVLSAVEGLKLVTPIFDHYVLPITVVCLVVLFLFQYKGTSVVASWFGPIMLGWFIVIASVAIPSIYKNPQIFAAFNPKYAYYLLVHNGHVSLAILGSVFLSVTGAEALYADMGHFGPRPIRIAWLCMVFPALILTYLGQGALVLDDHQAVSSPFFLLVPEWGLFPMVILATFATFIASQAVISGAYSLTRQAINLGLIPRFEVRHTSDIHEGQIYIPTINWLLLFGVLTLVLTFKTSSNLASAYGIAVTGTMLVTSMLACYLMRKVWNWPVLLILVVITPFLLMESVFLVSNLTKLQDGGYIPLILAISIVLLMRIWVNGTAIALAKERRDSVPFWDFIDTVEESNTFRPSGTAVFMSSDPEMTPSALLHNVKHNRVLHSQNIMLTVKTGHTPKVEDEDRLHIEQMNDSFIRILVMFGYMEAHNVPQALAMCRKLGLKFDIMSTTFFVGRRTLRLAPTTNKWTWHKKLFIAMSRWATNATDYHSIPAGRVIVLGQQVNI